MGSRRVGYAGQTVLHHFYGPLVALHFDLSAVGHVHSLHGVLPYVQRSCRLGAGYGHQILQVLIVDRHEGQRHIPHGGDVTVYSGEDVFQVLVGQAAFGLTRPVEESVRLARLRRPIEHKTGIVALQHRRHHVEQTLLVDFLLVYQGGQNQVEHEHRGFLDHPLLG